MKNEYIAVYDVKVFVNPTNEWFTIKQNSEISIIEYSSGGHGTIEAIIINYNDKEYWLTIPCFDAAFRYNYN